ncbi:hypothetical protein FRC04_000142 [Tulasnella sp. 424]|nr:hypothetical protein FRC04_000142 [Tulasnella sp. 424]KAG8982005.1 hypothetical protein FRC05_000147 [Tulasnella sp. 425]
MCYEYGSLDQGTANCIVCKLLGTNKANCPHKSQLRVCQDRQNHSQPIVFYTNAEYNIFNGCGYCKWAKRFAQSPDFDKLNNKGWPGCCRQPRLGEMELIDDADWPVVSKRYGLPDRSTLRDRPQRPVSLSKAAGRSGSSARRGSIDVAQKDERGVRDSGSPHRRGSPRIADPSPTEGSPRRSVEALVASNPGSVAANGPYRNVMNPIGRPSPSSSQQSISTSYIGVEEREPGMYHTRAIPRNGQAMPAPPATSNGVVEPQTIPRSSTIRRAPPAPSSVSSSSSSGYAESVSSNGGASSAASSVSSYDPRGLRDIHKDFENMNLSSTSSNRESIITVTSDGAFTDYLSDESEAELQRQAEARAAQLRRMRAEEAEFNAAKRGLANIDLQTPIAWAPTKPQPYNPSGYARR